jgi:hypothetical protein
LDSRSRAPQQQQPTTLFQFACLGLLHVVHVLACADCVLMPFVLQKRVHELKGRRLDAKAAVPKAHLGTAKLTKKMFVGGTGELTDQDFREHFSQYGDIEDAAVGFWRSTAGWVVEGAWHAQCWHAQQRSMWCGESV